MLCIVSSYVALVVAVAAPAQGAARHSDPGSAEEAAPPSSGSRAQAQESTIEFPKSSVRRSEYGLGVSSVTVDRGPERYKLAPKTWNQIVREDPDLALLHRRGRLLGPGIGLTVAGGTWLAVSTAFAIDGFVAESAVGDLFQWAVPAALFFSGGITTLVAMRSRARLRSQQRRWYASPYASKQNAGLAIGGRF